MCAGALCYIIYDLPALFKSPGHLSRLQALSRADADLACGLSPEEVVLLQGKADARPAPRKEPAAAESAGAAGGAPDDSPKRGRGRPSKAAAKTKAPTKRTR